MNTQKQMSNMCAEIADVEIDTYPAVGMDMQYVFLTLMKARSGNTAWLHPADARELGKLLIEAADIAEQKKK